MDGYHDTVAWVLLAGLLVVLFLLQAPAATRALGRLGEWAGARLTAHPEPDQEAVDLYQALRRERLVGHVARLRRILAEDSHQSAVRQIGNRIAYGQLLAELAEIGDTVPAVVGTVGPEELRVPDEVVAAAGRPSGRYAPRVETLDLGGWRRH